MKSQIIALLLLAATAFGARSQAQQQPLFQMPVVPDSIVLLYDRTDYLLAHYWDFCDIKKAFSTRDRFRGAVIDYFSLMPYGTVDGVKQSISTFMKKVSTGKEPVQFVADIAEATFYSDTAALASDQLYLMFLDELLANKKVDKNTKLRYAHQKRVLEGSRPGQPAPALTYTDPVGSEHTFAPDTTKAGAIIFFNDPDCSDCSMARLRIDADILSRTVIEKGIVDFYSIYPGDADAEWLQSAVSYPEAWKTGASPDADQNWDIRQSPLFYILNRDGNILMVTANADEVIDILGRLAQVSGHAPSAFNRNHSKAATPEPQPEPQP